MSKAISQITDILNNKQDTNNIILDANLIKLKRSIYVDKTVIHVMCEKCPNILTSELSMLEDKLDSLLIKFAYTYNNSNIANKNLNYILCILETHYPIKYRNLLYYCNNKKCIS